MNIITLDSIQSGGFFGIESAAIVGNLSSHGEYGLDPCVLKLGEGFPGWG
jgi:hypothetical protein